MTENQIIDKYLSNHEAEYNHHTYILSVKLLKRLINMKQIDKFEVENIIRDAKRLIYPTVHQSDTLEK
jgi:hypothetical protein